MSKETGGPAFPNTVRVDDEQFASLRGMTLRDYFAARAMHGAIVARVEFKSGEDGARAAYALADLMLAERSK